MDEEFLNELDIAQQYKDTTINLGDDINFKNGKKNTKFNDEPIIHEFKKENLRASKLDVLGGIQRFFFIFLR